MAGIRTDFIKVLAEFSLAQVDFIVVGGVAAILNDVVYSPRPADLAGHGHVLLKGPLGRLDLLCELSGGRGYEELLPHSREISEAGLTLRVLDLPMLITVKSEAGRGKDLRAIPDLLAALEERKKRI